MKTTQLCMLAVLALPAMIGCASNPSHKDNDPPSNVRDEGADFYGLLRRVQYDYAPYKAQADMRQAASDVVVGRVVDVSDGRTFNGPPGNLAARHTAVMKVSVERTAKGAPTQNLYVEIDRGVSTTIAELRAQLPDHRMALFLRELPEGGTGRRTFDEGKGHPRGTRLHRMVSPQAMVVEASDRLHQPLVDDAESLHLEATSLEGVGI